MDECCGVAALSAGATVFPPEPVNTLYSLENIMAITVTSPSTSSATLSSTGLGSGIDINGLVTKLMSVEQRPLALLQTQEAAAQAKISAYGSLKGAVAGLQSAAQTLANPELFLPRRQASAPQPWPVPAPTALRVWALTALKSRA